MSDQTSPAQDSDPDIVVVGAGLGGMYAVHRFRADGLRVVGLELADGVGGVWRHNRYPGARVDIESWDYCFYFSAELYQDWTWTERYASQPELLAYLEHAAQRFGLLPYFRFHTRMEQARWDPESGRWVVTTGTGDVIRARFLVMATGNLSEARKPPFEGIDDFEGDWVVTSDWPEHGLDHAGKRVAVIGTGASGSQSIPVIAEDAGSLHVFQRTANFCVPSHNGAMDVSVLDTVRARVAQERTWLRTTNGTRSVMLLADYHAHSPAERVDLLERSWREGGHGVAYTFRQQGTDPVINEVAAEFVRGKIRETVEDPATAERLCPTDHPIGSRRLVIESGYYETFNQGHVTLVDLREEPIERITPTGIRTSAGEYELDVIVLAIGFDAFTGALDATDIRNERGEQPTDGWARRPVTLLGLMTAGFPNLFLFAGPGSPATLTNVWVENEYHADWVADAIGYLDRHGYRTMEATIEGQDAWSEVVDEASAPLLRRKVRNYMTHFNEDGSSYFIPYAGGLARYVELADEVAAKGYEGFELKR